MSNSKKTVLLFQPSKFQAEVWHFILWEQDIFWLFWGLLSAELEPR